MLVFFTTSGVIDLNRAKIMQERLAHIVFDEIGVKKSDRILIAVSGGADSIVLLRLLRNLGHTISAAHCNFSLRGEESDEDERFVRELCDDLGIELYCKRFETGLYAQQNKLSIQEAARNLRYTWFFELLSQHNHTFLATAHHKTDNLETVLINQIRGTGIKGYEGITSRPKQQIIRPLLHFTSKEIRALATEKNWAFRNDSSNDSLKYLRNQLRKKVIPKLLEIEPNLEEIVLRNSQQAQEHNALFESLINQHIKPLITEVQYGFNIPILPIQGYPQCHILLYNILSIHGFSYPQCVQIAMSRTVGSTFESNTALLTVDREFYMVSMKVNTPTPIQINNTGTYTYGNYSISVEETTYNPSKLKLDKNTCLILKPDTPLFVRSWKKGERIQPFGTKGSKPISDVFIDAKVPLHKKPQTPILATPSDVIWVAGLCFSEKFKLTESDSTSLLWKIQITPLD